MIRPFIVTLCGVLGLTLACARCHDHKFDAIPTADYYSLYGILAASRSCSQPSTTAPSPTMAAARSPGLSPARAMPSTRA